MSEWLYSSAANDDEAAEVKKREEQMHQNFTSTAENAEELWFYHVQQYYVNYVDYKVEWYANQEK